MAAPPAKVTFAEDLGTEVVSIFAGSERKHFVVHKQLLTSQSDYFDKALNGRFKEAEDNSIYLEEDDPVAVGLLIGWLYRGVIPGSGKKHSPFTRATTGGVPLSQIPDTKHIANGTLLHYTPFLSQDYNMLLGMTDSFMHICCDPQYRDFSPEELRAADYNSSRRYAPPNYGGPNAAAPFQPIPIFQPGPPVAGLSSSAASANPFSTLSWPHRPTGPAPLFPPAPATTNLSTGHFPDTSNHVFAKPEKEPGDFGNSLIKYPKSPGRFIDGIPRSEPFDDRFIDEIAHQDALLHLCLLAESVCWPKLFNAAIDAYTQGEVELSRDIPIEHVDLIYDRTHVDSTLRAFAIDSIQRLLTVDSHKAYVELAQQYEDFLESLLKKFSTMSNNEDLQKTTTTTKNYRIPEDPVAPNAQLTIPPEMEDEAM